jgi:two-component system cell cycle sensor histidine kinase/response regulator CckA
LASSTSSLAAARTAERLGVLLVDDDDQLLRTLSDILRHRGYEPSTAASGREGLSVASRSHPEPAIALVDLALPDMTGLELVHQLRRVSTLTEIVILTGNASLNSAVAALREHSYDYLIKPVPPERLLATLERAGDRWRRRRAESALLESEERLRLLIENISELVLILDLEGRVTYASPASEAALGYTSEELAGRRLADFVRPEEQQILQLLLSSTSESDVEMPIQRRDGTWGLFACRTRNLVAKPAVSGLVLIAQDVTESRRLQTQALQAQKLDSIGRLAGGVAHDFNNLLSVVIGFSQLSLQRPGLDPELRPLLETIHEAGERGAALTSQLLAFARRRPAEARLLDPNQLIRGLESFLRRTLGEDVELVTDLDPEAGSIRFDPAQLEQVLMNLVVNAREAMPGGGRLRLSTRRGRRPENFLELSVRDSGVGMSEEVKERLFEPFFTTKEMGTGLGLATTYGLVRQAGGHLAVESAPGEGSSVTVFLPVAQEAPGPAPDQAADLAVPRGTETVLVVEDEEMVRHLVRQVLESQGYEVLTAADGQEALAMVHYSAARPALLLTDLVMPGMGGAELASRVADELPGLRVLMMSGYSGPQGDQLAQGPPLLRKPFGPGQLARAVRAALDNPPQT